MSEQPEPKYRLTETKSKPRKEVPQPPQPIEPSPTVIARLDEALGLLESVERMLRQDGRVGDANYVRTTIADIMYRHIVRAKQTACTRCTGYRANGDVPILGVKCRCTATVAITGGN